MTTMKPVMACPHCGARVWLGEPHTCHLKDYPNPTPPPPTAQDEAAARKLLVALRMALDEPYCLSEEVERVALALATAREAGRRVGVVEGMERARTVAAEMLGKNAAVVHAIRAALPIEEPA